MNILQNSLSDSIDTNEVDASSRYCLNNGTLVKGVCICDKNFRGSRCELPVCQNYCVGKATCQLDAKTAQPVCHCARGWEGPRCEHDRCLNFCLNDGRCSVDGRNQTICQCPDGYRGARCQYVSRVLDELCQPLCEVQLRSSKGSEVTKSTHREGGVYSIADVEKVAPQLCRWVRIRFYETPGKTKPNGVSGLLIWVSDFGLKILLGSKLYFKL